MNLRARRPMNSRQKLPRLLVFIFTIIQLSSAGFGHSLGLESVDHDSHLHITPEKITIFYSLEIAEIPTIKEIKRIDANGDGKLDGQKLAAYTETKAHELAAGLYLSLNGHQLKLKPVDPKVTVQVGQGGLSTLKFFSAMETVPGALASVLVKTGTQTLSFHDDNERERLGWRLVGIIGAAADVIDESVNGIPTKLISQTNLVDDKGDKTNVQLLDLHFLFRPTAVASPSPAPLLPIERRQIDPFTALMSAENLTIGKMILFLLFATGLGGMHALSPGHGKTLVAAYLVGARGTARHALILGLTVTITHTVGVFALGLIALFASKYFLPDTIYPWLTAISGLVIAQVGLWRLFIFNRGRTWRRTKQDHVHVNEHLYVYSQINEHSHEHRHSHSPELRHMHSHGGFAHSHLPPEDEPITLRNLLALGISGGALPCPSALVVLLSAVALHRIAFGLLLILSFSVGLAAVLTAVGIAVLHAHRHLSRSNLIPASVLSFAPKIGALVITIIGLFLAAPAIRILIGHYGL